MDEPIDVFDIMNSGTTFKRGEQEKDPNFQWKPSKKGLSGPQKMRAEYKERKAAESRRRAERQKRK